MTGTLRDRLAAILGPGNNDAAAYAQADAVLELLALETQRTGICGATPTEPIEWAGMALPIHCTLAAEHIGMHETDDPRGWGDGHVYWPQEATA